ncbi:MAG: DUF2849 domain-containing protein [Maritimibacter sp.]
MAKQFSPGVISANDLISGAVIYLAANDTWVDRLEDAELITAPERAEARLTRAEAEPEIAVGAYLAPAVASPEGPKPAHFRETFRAAGPSAPARKSWGQPNV